MGLGKTTNTQEVNRLNLESVNSINMYVSPLYIDIHSSVVCICITLSCVCGGGGRGEGEQLTGYPT